MTGVLDFATAPVAPHSAQFPLGQAPNTAPAREQPSPTGVRQWGLSGMRPARQQGDPIRDAFAYDHTRKIAVDRAGRTLVHMAPTANSVSDQDGDEGVSEDWTYDFAPDQPFQV